jgi:hypothetical protein
MAKKKMFLEVDLGCSAEASLSSFALTAEPTETHVYGTSQQKPNHRLMMLAYAFYTQGLVHLVQKRVGTELYYVAVKRKVGKVAKSV